MTALLLSIRPRFAQLILSGQKTIEVRRVAPRNVEPGKLILIYASGPERALWGMCFLDGVSIGQPETIWRKLGKETGLRKKDFVDYLQGAKVAVALHVAKPVAFSRPIPLEEIRGKWSAFQPPQSFSYVPLPALIELAKVDTPSAPALSA